MNSIVLELQRMASDNKVLITDLLKKALIVASKFGSEDFKHWVIGELEGYPDKNIPSYRIVPSIIKARNPYDNSLIHCQFDDQSISENLSNIKFSQSIGYLEALVTSGKDKNGLLEVTFTQEVTSALMEMSNSNFPPTRFINEGEIIGILETVRTMVLKWALELEKKESVSEIETPEVTSEPGDIVGDTWNVYGLSINIENLRTKLKANPVRLFFCLLVILLIVTFPIWWPIVS